MCIILKFQLLQRGNTLCPDIYNMAGTDYIEIMY